MKNSRCRALLFLFFTISILFLCSCIQSREEYTLNPDGSGKLVIESTQPLENFIVDENKPPREEALEEIDKILKTSKGVEAWQDVTYDITADGNFHFTATAFFPHISQVEIGGSLRSSMWEPHFTTLPDGHLELILPTPKEETSKEDRQRDELTPEELAEQAKVSLAKFKQSWPLMESFFRGYRLEKIFHLPGLPKEITAFNKLSPRTVSIVFEGDKILQILTDFINDEEYWLTALKKGVDISDGPSEEDMRLRLFGTTDEPRVLISGADTPLLDFHHAVEKARQGYPDLRKQLGLAFEPEMLPPAQDNLMKNIRIAGIQKVFESNQQNNLRPFMKEKGYTLSIIGEFTGTLLNIQDANTKVATTNTGEDVLAEDKYHRNLNAKLSTDKTKLMFEVQTKLPTKPANKLQEISGEIIYETSEGIETVSLGTLPFKPGTKGEILNTEIMGFEESQFYKDDVRLKIKLEAQSDHIKDVYMRKPDGQTVKLATPSLSQTLNTVVLSLRCEEEFPEEGELILEMHQNVKRYTIPFKLENISL